MELADVTDSKSVDGDIVWVRVPPPAPKTQDTPKEYPVFLLLGGWVRNHFKLPLQLSFALCSCSLLPNLFGGVQSPTTGTKIRGAHLRSSYFAVGRMGEKPLQTAVVAFLSSLFVQFVAELRSAGFRVPPPLHYSLFTFHFSLFTKKDGLGQAVFFQFSSPLRPIRYAMTERRVTIPTNMSRSSTTGTKF